jgi:hypothetical protein
MKLATTCFSFQNIPFSYHGVGTIPTIVLMAISGISENKSKEEGVHINVCVYAIRFCSLKSAADLSNQERRQTSQIFPCVSLTSSYNESFAFRIPATSYYAFLSVLVSQNMNRSVEYLLFQNPTPVQTMAWENLEAVT